MAYFGSKGWLVQQLKEAGVRYHPVERKKWKHTKLPFCMDCTKNMYRKSVNRTLPLRSVCFLQRNR